MKAGLYQTLLVITLSAGSAMAQSSVSVHSDLLARASDSEPGETDTIAFTQSALPGASFSHDVLQTNPQTPLPTTASSELTISRPHNFRPTSDDAIFFYDIDITGRVARSTPFDTFLFPNAQADLEIVFGFDTNPLASGLALSLSGEASYTTDQNGVGAFLPVPAFEVFGRAPGGDLVVAELLTDDPSFGQAVFGNVMLNNIPQGSDLVIRARADISDQLTFDDGASVVEFNLTLSLLGPIPAPSSAALLGLGGVVAARRRR